MSKSIKSIHTRFRGYQLGEKGSSFSYFAGGHFTLLEAMVTDLSEKQLLQELKICKKDSIDQLHITSWDVDHCKPSSLEWLLTKLKPHRIEYPGYQPHTDAGFESLELITAYRKRRDVARLPVTVQAVDPTYVSSLTPASALGYSDIVYHPKKLHEKSNNNSTVKFFRRGSFNVLSLGDVEAPEIGSLLRRCKTLCREIDVMILAHHGADNGFTTKTLLEALKPTVAVCSSNYANNYDHPRQSIRDLLHEQEVRLFTTKTGDVVMESIGSHVADFEVKNLKANSSEISSHYQFRARKFKHLTKNADSVRNLRYPGFKGLR